MPSINLSLGNNQTVWNWLINVNLQIKDDTWWQIIVKNIKWIENFNIVWQSQSQSSSTSIVSINWKTQQKTITTYNITLSLKPKNSWEFTLWPTIVSINNKIYKSNSIKINTKNIQTSQIIPSISTQQTQTTPQTSIQNQTNHNQNFQQTQQQIPEIKATKIQTHNYYWIISLLIGLIILWIIIVYKFIKEDKNSEKIENNLEITQTKTENIQQINTGNDFLTQLSQKYNINLHTKTYSEIKELLKDKLTEEEDKKLEKLLIEQFKAQ